jgi:hypothetical protein
VKLDTEYLEEAPRTWVAETLVSERDTVLPHCTLKAPLAWAASRNRSITYSKHIVPGTHCYKKSRVTTKRHVVMGSSFDAGSPDRAAMYIKSLKQQKASPVP